MTSLIINPGSTSVKYALFKNGKERAAVSYHVKERGIERKEGRKKVFLNGGIIKSFEDIYQLWNLQEIRKKLPVAIRIVHDGDLFDGPTKVTKAVLKKFTKTIPFAPLHNQPAYELMRELKKKMPTAQLWMFFDTSFHHGMPEENTNYGLSEKLSKKVPIKRKGFHGIAVSSVVKKLQKNHLLKKRTLICHLGGGSSLTVLREGKSVYNSMGVTALEGPLMISRSGTIDPGLLLLLRQEFSHEQLESQLYKESGIKALCGTSDMKTIIRKASKGQKKYRDALNSYCRSVAEEIGRCLVIGQGVDLLVFTGGVGANAPAVREKIVDSLQPFGAKLHHKKNSSSKEGERICRRLSRIQMRWMHSNEHQELAYQLEAVLKYYQQKKAEGA
jgi:acetate kinase